MLKALEKRVLGKTGEKVTFIGFSASEIGRDWGLGNGSEIKCPEEVEEGKVLNLVLDMGINIIDTASAYHKSEERIGKFISHRRNEYFLTSKCGEHNDEPNTYYDFSYKAVKSAIDNSLLMLKTDYINLMQIHFGPDPQKVIDEGETLAAMKDAQKEGKVKFLGASCDGDIARQCIESGNFDVMHMNYSLLNRSNEELISLCGKKDIGVLIRGGFARGLLTSRVILHLDKEIKDKDKILKLLEYVKGDGNKLSAVALKFLYNNPNISSVLLGTKNVSHLKNNIQLLEDDIELNFAFSG